MAYAIFETVMVGIIGLGSIGTMIAGFVYADLLGDGNVGPEPDKTDGTL